MPTLLDIGKRAGQALGAGLYTAAGQLFYSTASGVAGVLAAPTAANQPLVASSGLVPSWGAPNGAAVVAADVVHAQSNTTLSDVTGLLVPVSASATEIWWFELYLLVTATTGTVDIKYGWTYPTSTTMQWGAHGSSAAGQASFNPQNSLAGTTTVLLIQTDVPSAATQNTATAPLGHSYAGFIFGGGTAGNAQFQFAQNTSDASNLTIKKGSMLRYQRVIA